MNKPSALLSAAVFAALIGVPADRRLPARDGDLKANLDLPFDAIGEDEEEEEAPEVIVFYGAQYEGDFFCFTCDRSGSMEGERWTKLQREVVKNIAQFSERVQFGIVFFAGDTKKFPPSGQPADANPGMKAAAISMVMSTTLGRQSCYKEALFDALAFASRSSTKRKVIICLGDGELYCSGQRGDAYGQQALTQIKARNVSGAKINCIGIAAPGGEGERWLKTLAAQNNGQYRRGE